MDAWRGVACLCRLYATTLGLRAIAFGAMGHHGFYAKASAV